MIHGLEGFLYSRKNIGGLFLALGGPALFFTGVLAGLVWLPITAALYMIGVLLVPGERALDLTLDASADSASIKSALDSLTKSIKGRVPDDIYASVSTIRDSIMVTLQNGNGNSGGGTGNGAAHATVDPNVYLIRQTAMSYLPEALNAYLALPRLYANRSLGGRKSAHDTLLDQLTLMNSKMNEVAEAIVAHDTDRLEAHGRFLAEKFGGSTLDIASPAAQVTSAAAPAATPADADTVKDRMRG